VISLEDVVAAAARLDGVAHRTPVLTSRTLDGEAGSSIFLKAECFQRGGSFKIRGAYNRISTLDPGRLAAGVATYSSGNHAQAVAIAAGLVGARAVILMPEDAPPSKVAATRGYGAEIVTYDRYREDRTELGERLARDRGMALVPPYDDPMVMAGQGTAALELIEDAGPFDVMMAPIGGGGLIAGCGTVARARLPGVEVIGVEPEAGDDTKRSLAEGRRVRLPEVPATIADGLQVDTPGRLTFEVNRQVVDGVVLVSDQEILAAMVFLFDRLKIVVEPSGAVAVAALLAGKVEAEGRRVGAILSGGNVSAERFTELVGAAGM
jgi:threo-3-hydroxy-L-aspartate ammonia-lyase